MKIKTHAKDMDGPKVFGLNLNRTYALPVVFGYLNLILFTKLCQVPLGFYL